MSTSKPKRPPRKKRAAEAPAAEEAAPILEEPAAEAVEPVEAPALLDPLLLDAHVPLEDTVLEETASEARAVEETDPSEDDRLEDESPAEPLFAMSDEDTSLPGDDTEGHPGLEKARPVSVSEAHLKSVLESLIFVSDKPVAAKRLARIARAKTADVERLLEQLCREYEGRGIELAQIAGGYLFRSSVANSPFVREIVQRKPVRLSRAQLETLAIAAYRQPLTRPELEEIRGVDSGSALKVLLERGLVKILGRKDEPGRPLLYGTTPGFLEFFGLSSLEQLPTLKEFTELSDESRALFARRTGEDIETIGDIEVPETQWAEDEENDAEAREEGHAAQAEGAEMEEAPRRREGDTEPAPPPEPEDVDGERDDLEEDADLGDGGDLEDDDDEDDDDDDDDDVDDDDE